jgi:hypothetical protein
MIFLLQLVNILTFDRFREKFRASQAKIGNIHVIIISATRRDVHFINYIIVITMMVYHNTYWDCNIMLFSI